MKPTHAPSDAVEIIPGVDTKKKWFTKVFGKTSKNTGPAVAEHAIVQDMASETDLNATSTENLLAEPFGHT